MTPRPTELPVRKRAGAGAFQRVVCGVNGTPESVEATRQATRIADPSASVLLVCSIDVGETAQESGATRPASAARLRQAAERALEDARLVVGSRGPVKVRVIEGNAHRAVLGSVPADHACLLALGSPGHIRPSGALLGSLATHAIHSAPCSVLVARPPLNPRAPFPQIVVVGLDGSAESARAFEAAQQLHERLGAELHPVIALGGRPVDVDAARNLVGELELKVRRGSPADVLEAATAEADLLVVGHRGLHSIGFLGTVAERVSHRAKSSVLVVRSAGQD